MVCISTGWRQPAFCTRDNLCYSGRAALPVAASEISRAGIFPFAHPCGEARIVAWRRVQRGAEDTDAHHDTTLLCTLASVNRPLKHVDCTVKPTDGTIALVDMQHAQYVGAFFVSELQTGVQTAEQYRCRQQKYCSRNSSFSHHQRSGR